MKRSDFAIKLTMTILFVAVALYFGLSLFKSSSRVKTETVSLSTLEYTGSAQGWAVRDERIIYGSGGNAVVTATEGERVKSGGQVGISYYGEQDIEAVSSLRKLTARSEQLREIVKGLSEDPLELIAELSASVSRHDMEELSDLLLRTDATVHQAVTAEAAALEQAEIEQELSALQMRIGENNVILSPESGIFTSRIDGYEYLNAEYVTALSPSELSSLPPVTSERDETAVGKIAAGSTWYYACVMNEESADELKEYISKTDEEEEEEEEKSVLIEFTQNYRGELKASVVSIGEPENGKCAVVFAFRTDMNEYIDARSVTAEVVFGSVTGIRVPLSAICEDEDGKFVYLATALQAEKVYVEVQDEYEGFAYVKDQSHSGGKMRDACEVITEPDGIEDGDVINK